MLLFFLKKYNKIIISRKVFRQCCFISIPLRGIKTDVNGLKDSQLNKLATNPEDLFFLSKFPKVP